MLATDPLPLLARDASPLYSGAARTFQKVFTRKINSKVLILFILCM